VGTLWSELGPVAESVTHRPRIYADANVPAGIVSFMRDTLQWDVLFVMDQPDLRRARDIEHFRLARQLRRTLVTLDRDYLDDRKFPPAEGTGILVIAAPDERGLAALLPRDHSSGVGMASSSAATAASTSSRVPSRGRHGSHRQASR
jgi:hypothetical protein